MEARSLEELLITISGDAARRDELVDALAAARVAIPLNKGLENGALAKDAKPLTLNAEQGYPVLATFTSPDKATPWIRQQPEYEHCLVTDFSWALAITPAPFGIALNPGYRHSLVLSPDEVRSLAGKPS